MENNSQNSNLKLSENINSDNEIKLDDLFPERKKLLLSLKEKINNFNFSKYSEYDNIENVILIESDFGTGKTFFAKKLNDYLDTDSIYFSAWENDYEEQPFMVVSKHILRELIKNKNIIQKVENFIKDKFERVARYILDKDFNVKLGIDTKVVKADIETTININEFINCIKEEKDIIKEFKNELGKLISELNGKKLVLIIDELDRCRPDYAMKVLEVVKHFFDIEGLIIIFFANKKALYNSIKALYNFDNNDTNGEDYIAKFFTERIQLNPIDYNRYITDCLADKLNLKTDITKRKLIEVDNTFNSFYILKNSLVELSKSNNITCRELNKIINKICDFYSKRINEKDNDWKYIINKIFGTYFIKVLNKKEYNEYNCIGNIDNKNGIKLSSESESKNVFYYSFSQYFHKKRNILNSSTDYKNILIEVGILLKCDVYYGGSEYIYKKEFEDFFYLNRAKILFCFKSGEKSTSITTFKQYFELAQKRDEILKSYDGLDGDKIERLKEILLEYDQNVKNFKNIYGDTDELTEEEFKNRKNKIDNTIKEIFLIN